MDVAEMIDAIRRTCIPEAMLPEDLALVLRVPVVEAEAAMRRGDFGRAGEAMGRPVLLRRDFLTALERLAKAKKGRP